MKDPVDPDLGADLLDVVVRLNRWATRHGNLALPVAQARLLGQIGALGAARIGDLARADHCSQPSMTSQIRRLEAAGLVHRCPDPDDGRAVRIALTDRGRALLDEVRAARTAALAPLLERLPAAERRRLRGALNTLTNLLDSASGPHTP